jgi:CheY-like chemotaxis protein
MDVLERAPFRANNSPPVVFSDHTSDDTLVDFLIASDDNQLRDVVDAALRNARYTGTFVRSGREVVRRVARQRTPLLLLLDQCLSDFGGLAVAQRLSARTRPRFILFGENLTTPVTVAAMQLGAFTVVEKPMATIEMVPLLQKLAAESRAAALAKAQPGVGAVPRSAAERWAMKVLRGCQADRDLKTLGAWATEAGSSYTSLCEICRMLDIKPLAARDLMRVLRAAVQSRTLGCRLGDLLDISDRRTLTTLMARAGVDPRRYGHEISIDQFLASQQFVASSNAGLSMLRAMLPH